jgi:hypothetical protein
MVYGFKETAGIYSLMLFREFESSVYRSNTRSYKFVWALKGWLCERKRAEERVYTWEGESNLRLDVRFSPQILLTVPNTLTTSVPPFRGGGEISFQDTLRKAKIC